MNAPQKYLNSPATKPVDPMTVLFYFPDKNSSASCEISGSVFDAIKAGAEREGISIAEFLSQAVALKNRPQKAGKRFVAISMAERDQKSMRAEAKECGLDLKTILGWGLQAAREDLKDCVRVQRKAGLSKFVLGLTDTNLAKKN